MMATTDSVKGLREQIKSQVFLLVGILLLLFGIEVVDTFLPGNHPLDRLGIQPRTLAGLPGIGLAPLLHGGFSHLSENSLPFFVLGWLILMSGTRRFCEVTLCVVVCSGMGAWLLGAANSVHIGLSGVIFGYFGFLLARGYYERKLVSIILAILVGFFYIGMLFQLVSLRAYVSWSGHFFGFLGGIGTAWAMFQPKDKLSEIAP